MTDPTRRLAAIMFTDIAGYTELSAYDEEKALRLIEKQRELLKPIVLEYEGHWLKEIGDGLLLSFASSKSAVNCAIKIQQTVKEIESLNLRIGIHAGDILEKGGDVFGDDVNIASRIEPFAAVGGIAISDKVQRDLSASPEFTVKYMAQPKLKGVRQEVKVYAIVSHGLPEPDLATVAAKFEGTTNKSTLFPKALRDQLGFRNVAMIVAFTALLLLSFEFVISNMTSLIRSRFDPGLERRTMRTAILEVEARSVDLDPILLQAVRSELYGALQRLPAISLIGEYEIRQLDTGDLTRKEISDRLKTDYIVTCSLLRMNGTYLVDAELYRRDQDNIVTHYAHQVPALTLQETSNRIADSLSHHFAAVLGTRLRVTTAALASPAEEGFRPFNILGKRLTETGRREPKEVAQDDVIYRVLVEGKQLLISNTLGDNLDAIALFEEALLYDSTSSEITVSLAEAYYQRAELQGGVEELTHRTEDLLMRAIGSSDISDEALATAHYLTSVIQLNTGQLMSARTSIRIAVRLNRSDPRIRAHFRTITKRLLEQLAVS